MEDFIYTVKEVSKLNKSNPGYIYELIKAGHLPVLKLGQLKVRRDALIEFLNRYEGYDLTDPFEVKELGAHKGGGKLTG